MVENQATPTSIAEVKNILKKIEKEREEMLYEQKIALEHAIKFAKIPEKKIKELIKELSKLDYIHEIQAFKIADLLPVTSDDVKTIFAKERTTLNESQINKILEIIKKYNI